MVQRNYFISSKFTLSTIRSFEVAKKKKVLAIFKFTKFKFVSSILSCIFYLRCNIAMRSHKVEISNTGNSIILYINDRNRNETDR